MSRDYDLIIIGSGPAGFSCAMQSAKFNKKVLMIEAHETHIGGAWVNTGTMPSKALREAAKTITEFNTHFGAEKKIKPYERYKMADLLRYKNEILEQEIRKIKDDLINNEVNVARGFARFADKHTVEVQTHVGTKESYSADFILIGAGCSPAEPKNFEIDHNKIFNYESILEITHIPRRLVIIGWGVHAMEYATTFAALGTRVSVLSERSDDLPFLDHEISEHFKNHYSASIKIRNNIAIKSIDFNSLRNNSEVHFYEQNKEKRLQVLETEYVLWLGGREPNIEGLHLDEFGIKTDSEGFIIAETGNQTSVANIYAAGDIIGFPMLTSAAVTQGRQAACTMFGIPFLGEPDQYPYGIYTIPEIANIGITEQDACNLGLKVTVGRANFSDIAKANITNQPQGILKLVFSTESLKLLGVHIIGDQAANLIHLGQSIMAFDGDIRYFIQHAMNYPTLSEAYRVAAFNGLNKVHKAGVKYEKLLNNNEK